MIIFHVLAITCAALAGVVCCVAVGLIARTIRIHRIVRRDAPHLIAAAEDITRAHACPLCLGTMTDQCILCSPPRDQTRHHHIH
jgi:hypothetical protein